MNVQVILDETDAVYTNGDLVSGNVVLYCPTATTCLSSIRVKFLGESRLVGNGSGGSGKRRVRETHLILSEHAEIFPKKDRPPSKAARAPLDFGYHAFPFYFEMPLTNVCDGSDGHSRSRNLTSGFEKLTNSSMPHVSNILPPSMSSSVAEIKYFIEATVTTSGIFKNSMKASTEFKFSPRYIPEGEMEERPPSLGPSFVTSEVHTGLMDQYLYGNSSHSLSLINSSVEKEPARVGIEARIPNMPGLRCGNEVPLQIIVEKENDFQGPIFLQSLQLIVVGTTHTRSQGHVTKDVDCWILQSLSNLKKRLGCTDDPVGTLNSINHELWCRKPLPPEVVPTFYTCNVARTYQLEILVGIQYGSEASRITFLELQMPIHIKSRYPMVRHVSDNLNTHSRSASTTSVPGYERSFSHRRVPSTEWPPAYCAAQPGTIILPNLSAPPTYEEALRVYR